MNFSKNKYAAVAIAILLIVSTATSVILIPNVSAHDPPLQITTNAYVAGLPNPIGVGQTTLIYMWLNRVFGQWPVGEPSGVHYAAVNNDYRFHNYKLTITDPDGQTTTQTFETIQDTTSSQAYSFTPEKVGTYILTFNFPGQNVNDYPHSPTTTLRNDTYLPSEASVELIVQEEAIPTYPDTYPLPNEYWARPIYAENPGWFTIASNWLGTGQPGYGGFSASFNLGGNGAIFYPGDAVGPMTSHVMWTKSLQTGGIVGGNNFEIQGNQYFEGSAYNQRYQNPIVINGKIYFNEPIAFTGHNYGPLDCVDLRTGELIWSRSDLPQMSFALIWDHEDPNQHGVFPAILATSNFARLFDADTGTPLFNVTGVPSASQWSSALGPNGEQLRIVFQNKGTSQNPNYELAQWNSTKLWNFGTNPFTGGSLLSPSIINASNNLLTTVPPAITSSQYGATFIVNGSVNDPTSPQNRFDWSVPIAWRNTMTSAPTVVGIIQNDIMIIQNGSLPSQGATFMGSYGFNPYTYMAISLKPESRGQILWTKTLDPPANEVTVLLAGIDPVNRVIVENLRETQTFVGYSMHDGSKLWTTEPQADFDYYGSQASGSLASTFAYGKLYSSAYAGILYCYDTATGERLFTYGNGGVPGNDTNSGFQVPGNYPMFVNAIGNDVVYLVTSEHTVETPVFKGAMTRAVNATTGEEIWTLSSYVTEFTTQSFAVADGYATWFNSYDNAIYSVGRGASQLTVSAPQAGITRGGSLIITGSLSDLSAGGKQAEQAVRFPNGLPLAADESMTEWMSYVYQQKPMPTNFKGVEVTIDVIDSNGNYRNIGTAMTDATGMYNLHWIPDIEGKYTVIATFHGTNGYWPSYSETAFAVDAPAATPAPTEAPAQSAADMYFVPAVVGIIVAIVVCFVITILLIRKRP
jgi:hypothetical protein